MTCGPPAGLIADAEGRGGTLRDAEGRRGTRRSPPAALLARRKGVGVGVGLVYIELNAQPPPAAAAVADSTCTHNNSREGLRLPTVKVPSSLKNTTLTFASIARGLHMRMAGAGAGV